MIMTIKLIFIHKRGKVFRTFCVTVVLLLVWFGTIIRQSSSSFVVVVNNHHQNRHRNNNNHNNIINNQFLLLSIQSSSSSSSRFQNNRIMFHTTIRPKYNDDAKNNNNNNCFHLIQMNSKSQQQQQNDDNDDDDDVDWESLQAELIDPSEENDTKNDDDWIPDKVKAQRKRQQGRQIMVVNEIDTNNNKKKKRKQQQPRQEASTNTKKDRDDDTTTIGEKRKKSAYTDEEEDIINAMGGKTFHPARKREEGYLGDCTLQEIATDYSVPICYIADVLCMWGVPIPIHIYDKLGDLVTGEQAFALLEAINTLDVATLHDRYSNINLINLCYEYNINIQDAFELCIREKWNLPFGVQTCLRIEQEDELLRILDPTTAMET